MTCRTAISGRHSSDISVHDNSSLSEDEVYRLAEKAEDWNNFRGGSTYEGTIGILNVFVNCPATYSGDVNLRSVGIVVKCRGELIGETTSRDEKFKSLYERVEKESLAKHVRKIDESRDEGLREARRILSGQ